MTDQVQNIKKLIQDSLDKEGKLCKIKAQIKASVYNTIEQQTNKGQESQFYWENHKIQQLNAQKEGQVALEIVKDFLEFYSLDYTQNVFQSEANVTQSVKRQQIAEKCSIKYNKQKPILMQMVESYVKQDFASNSNNTPKNVKKQQNDNQEESPLKKKYGIYQKGQNKSINPVTQKNPILQGQKKDPYAQIDINQNYKEKSISSDQYEQENFEDDKNASGFDEIDLDDDIDIDKKVKPKNNQQNKYKSKINGYTDYQSSVDDIGQQSHGYDKSIDSLEIEEYDYFENARAKK